jgi:hypothetical protein
MKVGKVEESSETLNVYIFMNAMNGLAHMNQECIEVRALVDALEQKKRMKEY